MLKIKIFRDKSFNAIILRSGYRRGQSACSIENGHLCSNLKIAENQTVVFGLTFAIGKTSGPAGTMINHHHRQLDYTLTNFKRQRPCGVRVRIEPLYPPACGRRRRKRLDSFAVSIRNEG